MLFKPMVSFLLLISFQSLASTKCPDEYSELQRLQSIMRHNGTNEPLRNRERSAFEKYDNCRKGKNNKPNNSHKASTDSKYKANHKSISKHISSSFSSSVSISGKFKGKKQNDWLLFYKEHIPKECKKPESTKQFSKCIEYRNKASKYFEMIWRQNNPMKEAPPSIKLGSG